MSAVVIEKKPQPKLINKFIDKYEYFKRDDLKIFQGNVLNSSLFNKEFIDLIVTSPPYNVGINYNANDDKLSYQQYLEFSANWIENCYKWSNTQARFLLNIPLDKKKVGKKV